MDFPIAEFYERRRQSAERGIRLLKAEMHRPTVEKRLAQSAAGQNAPFWLREISEGLSGAIAATEVETQLVFDLTWSDPWLVLRSDGEVWRIREDGTHFWNGTRVFIEHWNDVWVGRRYSSLDDALMGLADHFARFTESKKFSESIPPEDPDLPWSASLERRILAARGTLSDRLAPGFEHYGWEIAHTRREIRREKGFINRLILAVFRDV